LILLAAGLALAGAGAFAQVPQRPFVSSSLGVVTLKFGSSAECEHVPLPPPSPVPETPYPSAQGTCLFADGRVGPLPVATARQGETVSFSLKRYFQIVRVMVDGKTVELGAGKKVGWKVPGVGIYDVGLFVRWSEGMNYEEATYGLRLRVLSLAAANRSYLIQGNTQIGSFNLRLDPTLQGATEAFGAPTRVAKKRPISWNICQARWPEHGLTITFYNLGGQDSCEPQYGRFASATLTDRRWRTAKGLRIGDTFQKLTRMYAPRYWKGEWATLLSEIRRADCSLPRGCLYRILEAKVMNGRVVAFRVNYTAGGV
jgi:hypothetical protein